MRSCPLINNNPIQDYGPHASTALTFLDYEPPKYSLCIPEKPSKNPVWAQAHGTHDRAFDFAVLLSMVAGKYGSGTSGC